MINKKKIMIIDDEIEFLNEIKEILRMCDYKVFCLSNNKKVKEIAKKVKDIKPDLLLIDIYIEDKNGFDIVKCIKLYPKLKYIPVILMTGNKKMSNHDKLMKKYKINDCLFKPIYPAILLSKIKYYV